MNDLEKSILEGTVETLAYGGSGIVKDETGFVTFVAGTIPGEKIRYEQVKKHKNFALGTLVEVLSPSHDRCRPQCAVYGKCGGCQLQHLKPSLHLNWKAKWLRELLERIGQISTDAVAVQRIDPIWHYRQSVVWHVRDYKIGYFGLESHEHIPIRACPIFENKATIFEVVQDLVQTWKMKRGDVKVFKANDGRFILHFLWDLKSQPPPNKDTLALLKHPKISNIIQGVIHERLGRQYFFGDIYSTEKFLGLEVTHSALCFRQNHHQGSLALYSQLRHWMRTLEPGPFLDIYCGVGITGLIAAKLGFETLGIEINAHAVTLANKNAEANLLNAKFIPANAEKRCRYFMRKIKPCAVLVNPPRSGLSQAVRDSLRAPCIKDLFYFSCHPATLARDLRTLSSFGYTLHALESYDCFPQTTHLETAVWLKPTKNKRTK